MGSGISGFGVAGAPRLLEWTGERCVPWAPETWILYEHFHRYLCAAGIAAGRDVLDVGSGEGFGAALLATRARSVLGVDVAPTAVEHSRLNYRADNLEFDALDARELTRLPAGSFGAVVAFETLEHLAEHELLMEGVLHVLDADGIFIVSTPEHTEYSTVADYQNPFHVRELTTQQFREFLEARFANVAFWGQRAIAGSVLEPLGEARRAAAYERLVLERHGEDWQLGSELPPRYLMAVASNGDLPPTPSLSVLTDPGLTVLERAQTVQAQAEAAAVELRAQLVSVRAELELIQESVAWQVVRRARSIYGPMGGRDSRAGRTLHALVRVLGRLLGSRAN